MLKSFEIQGFRTFSHLRIENLGQVNLIVGKNNVGKTTLLEALRLYAVGGSTDEIHAILRERQELVTAAEAPWSVQPFSSLFYGWEPKPFERNIASFGPVDQPNEQVSIRLAPLEILEESSGATSYEEIRDENLIRHPETDWEPGIIVEFRRESVLRVPLPALMRRWFRRPQPPSIRPPFIPAVGVSSAEALLWWDKVSLQPGEQDIYRCLEAFNPPIERIAAIGQSDSPGGRVFQAKIPTAPRPVPLHSQGHGVVRMFHIALAAAQINGSEEYITSRTPFSERTETGVLPLLLIDEFENGVYHGVLDKLWQSIFDFAARKNLQVFATTHSDDCVKAFLKVSGEDQGIDGRLIRLEAKGGLNRAVLADESSFPTILDAGIEVR